MTEEPKFQTPPVPPRAPAFGGSTSTPAMTAKEGADNSIPTNNFAAALKLSPRIFETKIMAAILGGCVILGMILGAIFFGGSSAPKKVAPSGLTGVIPNPDIRSQMYRCGLVSNTSACVFYIVNHSRDDHYAEHFFEDVAKLTGRAPYRIRIENQSYAKSRIPPGYIAKIKVPPLR